MKQNVTQNEVGSGNVKKKNNLNLKYLSFFRKIPLKASFAITPAFNFNTNPYVYYSIDDYNQI